MRLRRFVTICAASALLGFAGCGGGSKPSGPSPVPTSSSGVWDQMSWDQKNWQ
jgi:hypothetical protein